IPYNIDPEKIRLYEGVPEALNQFQCMGFRIIIVTNQPGVALGYFEEHKLDELKRSLSRIFHKYDVKIDGFYYCPHHPEGAVKHYTLECNCRKPLPGMICRASREMDIDLTVSWMIGDILNDVEAGNRAGCKTILINNGNETEWENGPHRQPTYIAFDLLQAAEFILSNSTYKKHDKQHVSLTY